MGKKTRKGQENMEASQKALILNSKAVRSWRGRSDPFLLLKQANMFIIMPDPIRYTACLPDFRSPIGVGDKLSGIDSADVFNHRSSIKNKRLPGIMHGPELLNLV